MHQLLAGPTEELATLLGPANVAPHSDYQINLTGPFNVQFGTSHKVWVLVACQSLFRRVLPAPVRGLHTEELVMSLLTFAAREGSINFVNSDPASN